MSLQVIGAGLGRTGTLSLRLALNELGLGPCHHMEEVAMNSAVQVPLWQAALDGAPDWATCFNGYRSAVDWPTAAFWSELATAFPEARIVLSRRTAESWAESFSQTIYKLMGEGDKVPPDMQPWFAMSQGVVSRSGFPQGLDQQALIDGFNAHCDTVVAAVPKDRLLDYDVKQGWEPLCAFLRLPVPATPFPRTNDRKDFWDLVGRAMAQ